MPEGERVFRGCQYLSEKEHLIVPVLYYSLQVGRGVGLYVYLHSYLPPLVLYFLGYGLKDRIVGGGQGELKLDVFGWLAADFV